MSKQLKASLHVAVSFSENLFLEHLKVQEEKNVLQTECEGLQDMFQRAASHAAGFPPEKKHSIKKKKNST